MRSRPSAPPSTRRTGGRAGTTANKVIKANGREQRHDAHQHEGTKHAGV